LASLLAASCLAQDSSSSSTPTATSLPDAPDAVTPPTEASGNPTASVSVAGQVYVSPRLGQRAHAYFYDLVGPGAFLSPAITAGLNQIHPLKAGYPADGFPGTGLHPAHGTVPEWGEGLEGYSKRYADSFGQGLINTTVRYGLGEILREDVTYHRCTCTGAFPRAAHALGQTLIAHTRSGRALPSIPAILSPMAASEIAVVGWYPSRFKTSDVLRVSVPLFSGILPRNLVAEFRKGR